jgi:DNA-binding response OmpR family regulator
MVGATMSLRVLIVDDDENFRESAREFLSGQGFKVLEAADGYAVLSVARESAPSAVVLHIVMPRLGGLQAFSLLTAIAPQR